MATKRVGPRSASAEIRPGSNTGGGPWFRFRSGEAGRAPCSGFTLIELIVAGAVLLLAAMIGYPALQTQLARTRLTGACDQVAGHLLRARIESLRHASPAIVSLDLESMQLSAFLDANEDTLLSADERVLYRVQVPESQGNLDFFPMGPDRVVGDAEDPARAIVGFSDISGLPAVIFRADGSIDEPGAFRFADGRAPRSNVFEVRVAPRATAQIEIRKFLYDDAGGFDPELGGSWFPRGGGKWSWY